MPHLLTHFDYTGAHCSQEIVLFPVDEFASTKPAASQADWRQAHSVYPFGGTAAGSVG